MVYQSKRYNIDAYYENVAAHEGWRKDDFVWALEKLETMPREKLLGLCRLPEINLAFTSDDWERTTPEEEIVSALISDYASDVLLSAIRQVS